MRRLQVAMLAMTGVFVQSFVRFPGFPPFDVSNAGRPLAVFERLCSLETKSVLLALLSVGVFELTVGKQVRLLSRRPPSRGENGLRVASRTDIGSCYIMYSDLVGVFGGYSCKRREAESTAGRQSQRLAGR